MNPFKSIYNSVVAVTKPEFKKSLTEQDWLRSDRYWRLQYDPSTWEREAQKLGLTLTVDTIPSRRPDGSIYLTEELLLKGMPKHKGGIIITRSAMGSGKSLVTAMAAQSAFNFKFYLHVVTHMNVLRDKATKDTYIDPALGIDKYVCTLQDPNSGKFDLNQSSIHNSSSLFNRIAREQVELLDGILRWLVIDEALQFIYNTVTCTLKQYKDDRPDMLLACKKLFRCVLRGGGTIHLMDADYSWDGILALKDILGTEFPIHVRHYPDTRGKIRQLALYDYAAKMEADIVNLLVQGKRFFINCTSANVRSVTSALRVYARLTKECKLMGKKAFAKAHPGVDFENPVGVITADTRGWRDHASNKAFDDLEAYCKNYVVVITSPVMVSGISIDKTLVRTNAEGKEIPYFDLVAIYASGNQRYEFNTQFSARVRADVPRMICFSRPTGACFEPEDEVESRLADSQSSDKSSGASMMKLNEEQQEANRILTRLSKRLATSKYHQRLLDYKTGCTAFLMCYENYKLVCYDQTKASYDDSNTDALEKEAVDFMTHYYKALETSVTYENFLKYLLDLRDDQDAEEWERKANDVLKLKRRLNCAPTVALCFEALQEDFVYNKVSELLFYKYGDLYAKQRARRNINAAYAFVQYKKGTTFYRPQADIDRKNDKFPKRYKLLKKYGLLAILPTLDEPYIFPTEEFCAQFYERLSANKHITRNLKPFLSEFSYSLKPQDCHITAAQKGKHIIKGILSVLDFKASGEYKFPHHTRALINKWQIEGECAGMEEISSIICDNRMIHYYRIGGVYYGIWKNATSLEEFFVIYNFSDDVTKHKLMCYYDEIHRVGVIDTYIQERCKPKLKVGTTTENSTQEPCEPEIKLVNTPTEIPTKYEQILLL